MPKWKYGVYVIVYDHNIRDYIMKIPDEPDTNYLQGILNRFSENDWEVIQFLPIYSGHVSGGFDPRRIIGYHLICKKLISADRS